MNILYGGLQNIDLKNYNTHELIENTENFIKNFQIMDFISVFEKKIPQKYENTKISSILRIPDINIQKFCKIAMTQQKGFRFPYITKFALIFLSLAFVFYKYKGNLKKLLKF